MGDVITLHHILSDELKHVRVFALQLYISDMNYNLNVNSKSKKPKLNQTQRQTEPR